MTTPVIFSVIFYDDEPDRLWGALELTEFGTKHWHRAIRAN